VPVLKAGKNCLNIFYKDALYRLLKTRSLDETAQRPASNRLTFAAVPQLIVCLPLKGVQIIYIMPDRFGKIHYEWVRTPAPEWLM
jgi:hypothetical protein